MRNLQIIAMGAALVILAHVPATAEPAASPRKIGAVSPRMSVRSPAQDEAGYYVPNITDASGTSTPIMEVPGSVVVVPQRLLQDQKAVTLCDALRNVSGVTCR